MQHRERGRQVVNFSVAVNDSYKPKCSKVAVKVATFFNCSYWINPSIVTYLTKGTLVECFGRISVNAWTNAEGEAKASLNFHVNSIKLLGKSNAAIKETVLAASEITEPLEDLHSDFIINQSAEVTACGIEIKAG